MSRIFSVASTKGGVSKTSTNIFLASAFSISKGEKVVYFDTDSQRGIYEYREIERPMYPNMKEPYEIIKTSPSTVLKDIDTYARLYDIIFIDVPRYTKGRDDQMMLSVLSACDSVLIPIKSGDLDLLSNSEFIEMVRRIEELRKQRNMSFQYGAFISMSGLRPTDDKEAREFLEELGVHTLKNELRNIRELTTPYTFESLLEKSKRHRNKFEPFFNEVVSFFNL